VKAPEILPLSATFFYARRSHPREESQTRACICARQSVAKWAGRNSVPQRTGSPVARKRGHVGHVDFAGTARRVRREIIIEVLILVLLFFVTGGENLGFYSGRNFRRNPANRS
jgi:hypothetical protein